MTNEAECFFSVVIPTYNRAELLRQALESVFAQPNFDGEIIVIDDGSTDGTLALTDAYGDRIRVFQQRNRGPGAARNRGIQEARGRYVAFLDSDDLWFPWTAAVYRETLTNQGLPAFLRGKAFWFTEPAEIQQVHGGAGNIEMLADFLSIADTEHPCYFGASWAVVRRDVLLRTGGFTNKNINGEDQDLWIRLGTEAGFALVNAPPTVAYRQTPVSEWKNPRKNVDGILYLVEQEYRGSYPGGVTRRRQRLQILTGHVRSVALNCLQGNLTTDAWRLYRLSVRWHLGLWRWKFLVGFPLMATITRLKRRRGAANRQGSSSGRSK